jgi:hypothetical protein
MPEKYVKVPKPNATEYLLYKDFCHRHNIPDDMIPFQKKFFGEFGGVTGYMQVQRYVWLGNTLTGICACCIVVKELPANTVRTFMLDTDTTAKYIGRWYELQQREGVKWTLK